MKLAGSNFTRRFRMALGVVVAALAVMLAAALMPAAAQTAVAPAAVQSGPSAAGLWQKLENGKPDGWFLIVDRDGTMSKVRSPNCS